MAAVNITDTFVNHDNHYDVRGILRPPLPHLLLKVPDFVAEVVRDFRVPRLISQRTVDAVVVAPRGHSGFPQPHELVPVDGGVSIVPRELHTENIGRIKWCTESRDTHTLTQTENSTNNSQKKKLTNMAFPSRRENRQFDIVTFSLPSSCIAAMRARPQSARKRRGKCAIIAVLVLCGDIRAVLDRIEK